jgi:hypothetical protein
MTARLAVLALLAMVVPAFAQDKSSPKADKAPPKTITLHIDASKLPPDVLAALMKLATDQKGEPKKGDPIKTGGKKGEPEKPGFKKGEFVKPGPKKGEFAAPMTLGHAVVMAEKKGHHVVKAEAAGGVFVLYMADGTVRKIEPAKKPVGPEKGGKITGKGDEPKKK